VATTIALLLLICATRLPASAFRSASDSLALYAAVGPVITRYDVDVDRATLRARESVSVGGNVQYGWQHPNGRHLYVVWSDGTKDGRHGVTAFDIEAGSGVLNRHGADVPLNYRPIHVTTDSTAAHLLIAYNLPPTVTVHRLEPDGAIGGPVEQVASLHLGIYLHQVRVEPATGTVFVVGRGNYPEGGKTSADMGSVHALRFHDGRLSDRGEIASGDGSPFNPRHLDFHPSQRWLFLSVELQNALQMYRYRSSGAFDPTPLFTKSSLIAPADVRPEHRQLAGAIHVHPNGRFVYQANRGTGTTDVDGKRVAAGGSNSIAVFAINQRTGEPTLEQNADTRGLVPRTFALDPSGRILVAANQSEMAIPDGTTLRTVAASLSIFRVRGDGTLQYVNHLDVDTGHGRHSLFWMNIMGVSH